MKKNILHTSVILIRVFIVMILLMSFNYSFAQPESKMYGCKHTHQLNFVKAPPLTPTEILSLNNSNERSDTIDILHYNINLDFTNFSTASVFGFCEISIQSKMDNVNSITLDLLQFNIDSVEAQGQLLNYNYDGDFLTIEFPTPLSVDQNYSFAVHYSGQPTGAASGFGGLVFGGNIAYNLGIGLGETPYNYGRGWFPCFDTFVERSTFEFNIISNANRRAYCVGTFMGQDSLGNGTVMRSYELNQEIPTYLAGIAVGDYQSWQTTHTGAFGDVPLEILALSNDLSTVVNSLQYLDESLDNLEYWWGAYPWERVGYVMTGNGAMEHPTNVAYPVNVALNASQSVNDELMAHELGHHWWGNVVTLNGPQNMWIKEGPAEYSSYLFYEHVFNRDEFNRINKENLLRVLEEAHIDDAGYQALSPMPYEQTYGTHTYQKGALVIHNLRGYLGDSLFRVGMQSVLNEYAYSHMDAQQFRDHLTQATGVDLNPFFDAWIFEPGYAAYEVESMTTTAQGNDFDIELMVQQKLHAATVFHEQVPMTVTFVDENFNFHEEQIMISGEMTTVNLTIPIEPATVFMNGNHDLNLAVIGSHKTLTETGGTGILFGGIVTTVQTINDSSFLRVEEYRVAPDPSPTNVYDARLSKNHYFRVAGVLKDGFEAKGTYYFNGSNPNSIDYDLVSVTEDSLVLLYRPDPSSDWSEYPDYSVNFLGSSSNGLGFMNIEILRLGEYVLANADIPPVANEDVLKEKLDWIVYPNPTTEQAIIGGWLPKNGDYQLQLFDWQGKSVMEKNIVVANQDFSITMNLQNLPNGIYVAKILDAEGKEWGNEKLEVVR